MSEDCGRFQQKCDSMRGFLGFDCQTFAGGGSKSCKQCYQQARAQEDQCRRQKGEDTRFDASTDQLLETAERWGKWIALAFIVMLVLWWIFKE